MTITIQLDDDTGAWELWCKSPGMSAMPCGPRIFRGPPHPRVAFQHETKAGAEKDAQLIRDYLAQLPVKKQTKKEIRDHHE